MSNETSIKTSNETLKETSILINALLPNPLSFERLSSFEAEAMGIIVLMIFITHVLYFIFSCFCTYWDRVDFYMCKKAININDVPKGRYLYLITVQTNWRFGSGTTSKVFLQIQGGSRRNNIPFFLHNPYSPYRKIFQAGDISWFILNTCYPFGEIQMIKIYHDYSGKCPNWNLSKIFIKDLQTNKSWRFLAYCWIKQKPLYLTPLQANYTKSFGEHLLEWFLRSFRERPLTSFLYLDLSSDISRIQQLTITYFYVLFIMLINVAYLDKFQTFISWATLLNITIKSGTTYLLYMILKRIGETSLFTKRTPSPTELVLRVIFYAVLYFLCLTQTCLILCYSLEFNFRQALHWLILFFGGLAKNETIDCAIYSTFKAVIFALMSFDAFDEESAKVIYTNRVGTKTNFESLIKKPKSKISQSIHFSTY